MAALEGVVALVLAAASALSGAGRATASGDLPVIAPRVADTATNKVVGRAAVVAAWRWPLQPQPPLERGFDPPDQPWLAGHRGVDLAASAGQPVLAPEAGLVSFSGILAGRGVVVITHPGGLRSSFEPVSAALPAGATVQAGQIIASVASRAGHCAPQTCLHWGVRRGETYLDPLALVSRAPLVLLPLR